MSDWTLGVDVSKWQGEMDWEKCAAAGAEYAIIRAGSIDNITGRCYTDYQFERNSQEAPQHMKGVGYYWFVRPNWSIQKQTDYFADLLDGVFFNLRPVSDAENNGGLEFRYVEKQYAAFAEQMEENICLAIMQYTRKYWWEFNILSSPGIPEWAAALDLWTAHYNEWVTSPLKPDTWDDWTFWQWSADGNGRGHEFGASGSHDIDLNRFNGDVDTFMLYLLGETPPDPPDPPVDPPVDPPDHEIYTPYIVNLEPTGAVNVRTGVYPAAPIAAMYGGREVLVSDQPVEGFPNWCKVKIKEFEGYMHSRYLVEL
jgi:lysozyme